MTRLLLATCVLGLAACADIIGADFDDLRHPSSGAGADSAGGTGAGGSGGGAAGGAGGAGTGGGAGGELPAMLTLVTDDLRPGDLAVDATHVYYVVDETSSNGADGIWRVERGGGPPEQVFPNEPPIKHLVVDATHIYFTQEYIVKKVPKAGGSAVELYHGDSLDHIQGIALEGDTLYWTTRAGALNDGFIRSVGVDGTGFVGLLAIGSGTNPMDLGVNATSIIWANAQSHEVVSMPIEGGAMTPLASNLGAPEEVALNATHVCFSELGLVESVGLDGNGYASLSQSGDISGAAATDTHCYFGSSNGLLRASVDMANAVVLADVPNVVDVRYHGGRVFFTAETSLGIVFSVAP